MNRRDDTRAGQPRRRGGRGPRGAHLLLAASAGIAAGIVVAPQAFAVVATPAAPKPTAPTAVAAPASPASHTSPTPGPGALPSLDIRGVRSWRLANGLSVLFLANHRAPVATVQIFYHVGSKDEHVGIRGIAHMFEHMMFKGSRHVPPEGHARLLREVGGDSNAFTTEDVTVYHQTVPPAYVDFALRLEAERMRNLELTPATVDSERKVVIEEKRLRIENSPVGQAIERFRDLAYTQHPYRWTAAGMIGDLQKITPADCQRFYDTYYQPNNATVVVVGDVDEAVVRHALDTYFGSIPRAADPPRAYPREPTQLHTRDATLSLDANLPVFVAGYHIPAAASADAPALEVLAAILSSGQSSRLNQRLVRRDKVAVLAGGMADLMEDPGMFVVYAAHLPDKDVTQVRQALFDEVARVGRQPVSPEELARARNQLAASFLFGLESVDGVARELGLAEYVQGDWRAFSERSARYASVTAADVTRVAAKYLIDSNRTDVTLKAGATKVASGDSGTAGADR